MDQQSVNIAIIPVAGLGSRLLPATKVVPKELLVLVDKPLVQYVVEEIICAGIKQIIFVDNPVKQGRIERHFSPMTELSNELLREGKKELLNRLEQTTPRDVQFVTVLQNEPLGLGHAVLQAAPIVHQSNVAVILPDVIMADQTGEDLRKMIAEFEKNQTGQVMLQHVPDNEVQNYGIADLGGAEFKPGMSDKIKTVVEKPTQKAAPSNWALSGRYVLPASIFDYLQAVRQDKHGEFQLTDALKGLCREEGLNGWGALNDVHDCGNRLGFLKASHHFACQHKELGKAYKQWVNR